MTCTTSVGSSASVTGDMPMPLRAMPRRLPAETICPRRSPLVSTIATVAKRLAGSARYSSIVMFHLLKGLGVYQRL